MKLNELVLLEQLSKQNIIDIYILMSMPDLADRASQFISKEVLNRIRNNVVEELTTIIIGEVQHAADECISIYNLYYGELTEKELNEAAKHISKALFGKEFSAGSLMEAFFDVLASNEGSFVYEGAKPIKTLEDLKKATELPWTLGAIEKLFSKLDWMEEFGGPLWAEITRYLQEITRSSEKQFMLLFDRLTDIIHNSGSLLRKFKIARSITSYDELRALLDLKQEAASPRALARYASPQIRKLFRRGEWRYTSRSRAQASDQREISVLLDRMLVHYGSVEEVVRTVNALIAHYGIPNVADVINNKNDKPALASLLDEIQRIIERGETALTFVPHIPPLDAKLFSALTKERKRRKQRPS